MRKVQSGVVTLVSAWAISGCVPPPPAPTPATPSPATQAAAMCERLDRVLRERIVLGDAFELVIANDLDAAVEKAQLVRSRLDELLDGPPASAGVGRSQTAVHDAVEDWARMLDHAAAIIDGPGGSDVDRDLALVEGRIVLGVTDDIMRTGEPSDPIAAACPGLELSVDPVSFPPPPTNAALGLPDTVGDLAFEPHIGRATSLMSEALDSVGVDSTAVRQIEVQVHDGDGGVSLVEVLDRVEAPVPALADAIRQAMVPEAKAAIPEDIAGFKVFAYRHSDEPTIAIHVAARGDRFVILHDFTDSQVREILGAIR